jgi:hypothetical protein
MIGRSEQGVRINLHSVDLAFDRHHGIELDERAFAGALQELRLDLVGTTAGSRQVYVIAPGQSSSDRLEARGTRHCFVVDARAKRSVYCNLNEVFGTSNPDARRVVTRINRADRIYSTRIQEQQRVVAEDETNPLGGRVRSSHDNEPRTTVTMLEPLREYDEEMVPMHRHESSPLSAASSSRRFMPSAAAAEDDEEEIPAFGTTRHLDISSRGGRRRNDPFDDDEEMVPMYRRHAASPLTTACVVSRAAVDDDEESAFGIPRHRQISSGTHRKRYEPFEYDEEAHVECLDDDTRFDPPYASAGPLPAGQQSQDTIIVCGDGVEDLSQLRPNNIGIGIGSPREFEQPQPRGLRGAFSRAMSAVGHMFSGLRRKADQC